MVLECMVSKLLIVEVGDIQVTTKNESIKLEDAPHLDCMMCGLETDKLN